MKIDVFKENKFIYKIVFIKRILKKKFSKLNIFKDFMGFWW